MLAKAFEGYRERVIGFQEYVTDPGKLEISRDKGLEGLSSLAIFGYIQVISFESTSHFLIFL